MFKLSKTNNLLKIEKKVSIKSLSKISYSLAKAKLQLPSNLIKENPFNSSLDKLKKEYCDEHAELLEAVEVFENKKNFRNQLSVLYEIGDCINQLNFILGKVCGAETFIRDEKLADLAKLVKLLKK
jgi:hypothetical protein